MQNRGSKPRGAAQAAAQHPSPRGVYERGATTVQRRFPRSRAARSQVWDMPGRTGMLQPLLHTLLQPRRAREGVSTVSPPGRPRPQVGEWSSIARWDTSPAPNEGQAPPESSWAPSPRPLRPGEWEG